MSNSVSPLKQLGQFGQSVWLDYIRRHLLVSDEFRKLIEDDGVDGMTSNPTIFEKAIAGSNDYDEELTELARAGKSVDEIYEALSTADIRMAADRLRPIWERSNGRTGYVSYEVSPLLAHDTDGTIEAARRYFKLIDRPNLMIKVPSTPAGIPAIEKLIAEGRCINVTLMFSLEHYENVANAYIRGLEARARAGQPLDKIASVASVFVSRVETLVDKRIDEKLKANPDEAIAAMRGTSAVANVKIIYQRFKELFGGAEFKALAARGAHVQRPLWASTGTKDPKYSDIKYVQELIGPDTVNTMPPATMDAYRDHGAPRATLEDGAAEAKETAERFRGIGIDLYEVGEVLQREGVDAFVKSFDDLLAVIKKRCDAILSGAHDRQRIAAPAAEKEIAAACARLDAEDFPSRLWRKDPTLWKKEPAHQEIIRNALGWLTVPETMAEQAGALRDFADGVRKERYQDVVLLGMGGSSLCPETLAKTFYSAPGFPRMHVLDSTVPDQIRSIERRIDIMSTLFVVSSKSGGTVETMSHCAYFFEQAAARRGNAAGRSFVAITDAGTSLEKLARERGFRRIFLNPPDIGGRYSALSYFGLVPAALMGIDAGALVDRGIRMTHSSAACVKARDNAGVSLGAALGVLCKQGRDKLTLIVSPSIATFGLWLEQLVAESTGKDGLGIVPVCDEPAGAPEVYGGDRMFVYLRLENGADPVQDAAAAALEKAGLPLIRVSIEDKLDLGEEFMRWEIATATAGALLGIDAFDQPNVQESKDNTNRLLKEFAARDRFAEEHPAAEHGIVSLFCPDGVRAKLGGAGDFEALLKAFLGLARPGDYFATMAYVAADPLVEREIARIRTLVRNRLKIATTFGYGPRFLHSTGQLHKGGPNTGLFLQITQDHSDNPMIPNAPYGFATLNEAQHRGDYESLERHGRRVLRAHLHGDVASAMGVLRGAIAEALG